MSIYIHIDIGSCAFLYIGKVIFTVICIPTYLHDIYNLVCIVHIYIYMYPSIYTVMDRHTYVAGCLSRSLEIRANSDRPETTTPPSSRNPKPRHY